MNKDHKRAETFWNIKKDDINSKLKDHDKRMERKFNKILKLELLKWKELQGRDPDISEREKIIEGITARLAYITKVELEKRDKAAENRIKDLNRTHGACSISLLGINERMKE